MSESIRDNRGGKAPVCAFIDGQADAIHGDRTLGDNQRCKWSGDAKPEESEISSFLDFLNHRHPVDVAGDQMASKAILKSQR